MCQSLLILPLVNSKNESKHFSARGNSVQFLKYLSPKVFVFNSCGNSTNALVDIKYSFTSNGIFLHYSM